MLEAFRDSKERTTILLKPLISEADLKRLDDDGIFKVKYFFRSKIITNIIREWIELKDTWILGTIIFESWFFSSFTCSCQRCLAPCFYWNLEKCLPNLWKFSFFPRFNYSFSFSIFRRLPRFFGHIWIKATRHIIIRQALDCFAYFIHGSILNRVAMSRIWSLTILQT